MRSIKTLRRLCDAELRGLDLDLPFDAMQLCERFGDLRGRSVIPLGQPLPTGMPNGVWLVGEDADYFLHQSNTTRLHRDQILLHEFGHLIAGHQVLDIDAATAAPAEAAAADLGAALHRTCYDDEREWEAEMIASIIVGWAERAGHSAGRTVRHGGLRGLQRSLGGHARWL